MSQMIIKRFTAADEVRDFTHGALELVDLGGAKVGQARFEPGWRWSNDIAPIARTESCEQSHLIFVVSGRMRVRMDDGEEAEIKAGDVCAIPPGHDAWTVGNEACVLLDFAGMGDYAVARKEVESRRSAAIDAQAHA
jgi:uncharacterized cupin superfamily protein